MEPPRLKKFFERLQVGAEDGVDDGAPFSDRTRGMRVVLAHELHFNYSIMNVPCLHALGGCQRLPCLVRGTSNDEFVLQNAFFSPNALQGSEQANETKCNLFHSSLPESEDCDRDDCGRKTFTVRIIGIYGYRTLHSEHSAPRPVSNARSLWLYPS